MIEQAEEAQLPLEGAGAQLARARVSAGKSLASRMAIRLPSASSSTKSAARRPTNFFTPTWVMPATSAISRRLERLPHGIDADRERMTRVKEVQLAYDELRQALSPARAESDDVRDIARMIEEFRVSLWAQQLGTAYPVSEQRIYRAIEAVLG